MISHRNMRTTILHLLRRSSSGCTVPISLISKLRRETGASIQRCKEALEKSDKDVHSAIDFLRKRGETINATQFGDSGSSECRRVSVCVSPCATRGVLTVTRAQTDFATESELFVRFSEAVSAALLRSHRPELQPSLEIRDFSSQVRSRTLRDVVSDVSLILSEPVLAETCKVVSGDLVSVYLHNRSRYSLTVGLKAAVVALSLKDVGSAAREKLAQFGDRLARQVLATCPEYISLTDVPETVIEKERSIIHSKVADPNMMAKAFQGHMKRFAREKCLLDMEWIIPSDGALMESKTVRDAIADECKGLGLPQSAVNITRVLVQK
jgi:elongation factor Ts